MQVHVRLLLLSLKKSDQIPDQVKEKWSHEYCAKYSIKQPCDWSSSTFGAILVEPVSGISIRPEDHFRWGRRDAQSYKKHDSRYNQTCVHFVISNVPSDVLLQEPNACFSGEYSHFFGRQTDEGPLRAASQLEAHVRLPVCLSPRGKL